MSTCYDRRLLDSHEDKIRKTMDLVGRIERQLATFCVGLALLKPVFLWQRW